MLTVNTLRLLVASATVLILCSANKTSTRALRKCCPEKERLVFTSEGVNCTDIGEDDNGRKTDVWWWLPQDALDHESRALLNTHEVVYGAREDCDHSSMDLLRYDSGRDWIDFSFHARDNEIRVNVSKESSFHDPDVGRDDSFPPDTFCVDEGPGKIHFVLLCPCSVVSCVRKCCLDGHAFDKTLGDCVVVGETVNDKEFYDWLPRVGNYQGYYRLPGRLPDCKLTVHEITIPTNDSQLLVARDGSIKILDGSKETIRQGEYCADYNTANQEMILFCMKTSADSVAKQFVYGVVFIIGAICLLATVIMTAILPEMRRNIHGRMALAHNFMLSIGYFVTGISQLSGSTMTTSSCVAISLTIQFSILAAFFWLNVMCIDISWTFSGIRPIGGTAMQRDRKKFIYYSVYAWGGTTLISTATIIVEYCTKAEKIKPNFGMGQCFFNNFGAELLFFYGPMALLLIGNMLLFIYTAFKILAVKRETSILNRGDSTTSSKNKQTLILYLKLFCLMGVTWLTEVISWAVGGPNYWWYITDSINLLRAVFIFVIFCCKRTVYNMLRDKVLRLLGRDVPERTTSRGARSYQSQSSCTRTTATSNTPNANRKFSTTTTANRKPSTQSLDSRTDEFDMNQLPTK